MIVPFLDLKTQYESIRDEISKALQQIMDQTAFAGGRFVETFEHEFAEFCGCDYALGVGSGTAALWMALSGLGVGPGDEVITVPNTFIATAEAISLCGATPVFVDIDESTYNMNPDLLEDAITTRTKAVIPVHLFGQMVDMDRIMKIARAHELLVIEDTCQAHGAEVNGCRAGSIGDAGCFSFYPGKNLGAYGEAGAVVTNNSELAEKINAFRDHGQTSKNCHSMIGWNGRMDGFQGAVLSVKLKHLEDWNRMRRKNARLYSELLSDSDNLVTPSGVNRISHVCHVYAICTENRDLLMSYLAEKRIHCGIHYPVPIHLQDAYRFLDKKTGSFPMAEKCSGQFLSLPMYPELSEEQIKYTVREIKHFHAQKPIHEYFSKQNESAMIV